MNEKKSPKFEIPADSRKSIIDGNKRLEDLCRKKYGSTVKFGLPSKG